MSRKTKRNPSDPNREAGKTPQNRISRRVIVTASVVTLALAVVAGIFLYAREGTRTSPSADPAIRTALASEHAPTLGSTGARVHIVEFLDPACETCALFFPVVKQLMAENPDRIRLSIRHVAFHEGSDYVVKLLEASRRQDRYWQTLEALLASQAQWTLHHAVQPDRVWPAIAGVGLDAEQLVADMNAPEVTQRMQRDRNAALALKVTATPEYFVNGHPLPSFGEEQLLALVSEELQKAY